MMVSRPCPFRDPGMMIFRRFPLPGSGMLAGRFLLLPGLEPPDAAFFLDLLLLLEGPDDTPAPDELHQRGTADFDARIFQLVIGHALGLQLCLPVTDLSDHLVVELLISGSERVQQCICRFWRKPGAVDHGTGHTPASLLPGLLGKPADDLRCPDAGFTDDPDGDGCLDDAIADGLMDLRFCIGQQDAAVHPGHRHSHGRRDFLPAHAPVDQFSARPGLFDLVQRKPLGRCHHVHQLLRAVATESHAAEPQLEPPFPDHTVCGNLAVRPVDDHILTVFVCNRLHQQRRHIVPSFIGRHQSLDMGNGTR